MSDLKIIDELLCVMKRPDQSWSDLENSYNITQIAMARLREAWNSKEMAMVTTGIANYFRDGK